MNSVKAKKDQMPSLHLPRFLRDLVGAVTYTWLLIARLQQLPEGYVPLFDEMLKKEKLIQQ